MQQPVIDDEQYAQKAKRLKRKQWLRSAGTIGVGVAIFLTGWGIGSGRVVLGGRLQNTQNKNLTGSLDYNGANEVYEALKSKFDGKLDIGKLNEGLKQGLASASNDPYTEYFTAEAYKEFDEGLTGSFTGIGAELIKEEKAIVIVSPISGFPAEKAGLKPRDVLTEIDGKSAYDLSTSEAVKRIRGPKDTVVKLKIIRGGKEEKSFEITRAEIDIPSVEAKIEDGIGYMKISRFGDDTRKLTEEAALDFKQKGVRGVVLDLRGDPGGLLDVAVDVSSLWLKQGKPVLTERRDGRVVQTFTAKGSAPLNGVPTAVLIDEGSASASEIVAGALRDNNVATLVGEKSFGKGSVQQLAQLHDGSVLKVTIGRWYTPNGKNIDKEGIEPDKKVELTDEDTQNKRDPQKDAAIATVNK